MVSFRARVDMMPAPRGGFEFAVGDDKVSARTAAEIMPKVRAVLARHGVSVPAEIALAEYMCPRLGDEARHLCQGDVKSPDFVGQREALANCAAYAGLPMVPLDVVQGRLAACATCPRHERHWCLTCTGAFARLQAMMGGRRPLLPADRFSGVCGCARAYEAAVCSVVHGKDVWPDAPDTCWRRRDDV